MDTSKFLKQIRAIIREEIEYAMGKQITELAKMSSAAKPLREQTRSKPVSMSMPPAKKQSLNTAANKLKPKALSKTGTKLTTEEFSSLQDILSETRRSMEAAMNEGQELDYGAGDEYQDMRYNGGVSFDGNPMTAIAAESSMGIRSKYIADMDGEFDPSIPIQPAVQKALTRDYSALVAKMNQK